jgi:hypothetical protein
VEGNKEGDGFFLLRWGETKEQDAVSGTRSMIEIGAEFPSGVGVVVPIKAGTRRFLVTGKLVAGLRPAIGGQKGGKGAGGAAFLPASDLGRSTLRSYFQFLELLLDARYFQMTNVREGPDG